MDHWICLSDDDLDYILKFEPDRDKSASRAELVLVIRDIQDIIEEGLDEE